MLKVLAFVACVRVVSSSELYSDAESVRSAVKTLSNSVSQLQLTKVNSIALNALMSDVAKVEKLTPENKILIQNVSDLLDVILSSFAAERGLHQTELTDIISLVASCNTDHVIDDVALNQTATDDKKDHEDCRDEEKVLFDDDVEKCDSFDEHLVSLDNIPACVPPPAGRDQSDIDAWSAMLSAGKAWFTTKKTTYVVKRDECLQATSDLTSKNTECNTKQTTYESAFCQWRRHRLEVCSNLDTCYDGHKADYEASVSTIKPLADARTNLAAAILHVKCIVQLLIDDQPLGDLDASCPAATTEELAPYDNTYDGVDNKSECSLTPISVYPGHADWQNTAYTEFPAGLELHDTGVSCVA